MKRAVVALALLSAAAACVRTPPIRTLPMSINSVYIPMAENLSFEPGLEEELTRAAQEEFLMDGRIDVVSRGRADAMLWIRVLKFVNYPEHISRDDFPLSSRLTMVADVALFDPSDLDREKPLMTWEAVDVEFSYISDARRVIQTSRQDAYREALRALARNIVFRVLYTEPTETAEPPALLPPVPQSTLGREQVETRFQEIVTTPTLTVEKGTATEVKP